MNVDFFASRKALLSKAEELGSACYQNRITPALLFVAILYLITNQKKGLIHHIS